MKPIETVYEGYRFRSRTEARWAVFFDRLGFRWLYEEQGYHLPKTGLYLPDFKIILPDGEARYCEVQSEAEDEFDEREVAKLQELADESGIRVLHLTGAPGYRPYNQFIPGWSLGNLMHAFFQDYAPYVRSMDGYWVQSVRFDEQTGRFRFAHDDRAAANSFGKGFVEAVRAAKQARFEHGERPRKSAKVLAVDE